MDLPDARALVKRQLATGGNLPASLSGRSGEMAPKQLEEALRELIRSCSLHPERAILSRDLAIALVEELNRRGLIEAARSGIA